MLVRDVTIARSLRFALRIIGLVALAAAIVVAQPPSPPAARRKAPTARGTGYAQRDDVRAFIDELAREHGFSRATLRALVRDGALPAEDRRGDAAAAARAAEVVRVRAAVPVAGAHRRAASRSGARTRRRSRAPKRSAACRPRSSSRSSASRRTTAATPAATAIIDALATLAFDYPRRAAFFRGELREFLLLAREQGFSPLAPKGSFAGAMGVPQFMPGSYRRYAVDFDGDGRVDLWRSDEDAIGSVANYLARHDWLRGQPVLVPATIAPSQRERRAPARRRDIASGVRSPRGTPTAWPREWLPDPMSPSRSACSLLEEPPDASGEPMSLWIACPNFYVITRYNKSRLYAAAVTSARAGDSRRAYGEQAT